MRPRSIAARYASSAGSSGVEAFGINWFDLPPGAEIAVREGTFLRFAPRNDTLPGGRPRMG